MSCINFISEKIVFLPLTFIYSFNVISVFVTYKNMCRYPNRNILGKTYLLNSHLKYSKVPLCGAVNIIYGIDTKSIKVLKGQNLIHPTK